MGEPLRHLLESFGFEPQDGEIEDWLDKRLGSLEEGHASQEVSLQAQYNVFPDEQKKYWFIFQNHFRGKSVHLDFRYEVNADLRGWTIDHARARAVKEDVESLADAKRIEKAWKTSFKLNNEPGMEGKKLLVHAKAPGPNEWLTFEGVVAPGEVGATKTKPGVFSIWDHGQIEFGCQKSKYHEYFLAGRLFDGRWLIRQLPASSRSRPGGAFIWLCWKAKEPRPYVLSKGAVDKVWIGPQNISSLPGDVRKQIPSEFKYWKHESKKERLQIRKELVLAIGKEEIRLNYKIPGMRMMRESFRMYSEDGEELEYI